MQVHLTKKNLGVWLAGVCGVGLAAIAILVPPGEWLLPPWKWVVVVLVVLVILGLTIQLLVQSKEDHAREEKERQRDQRQEGIDSKLTQLLASGDEQSLSVQNARAMVPPVNFDAKGYFQMAHQSAWTADVEKRIRVAAVENKSSYDTEEFYSKFIGIGLVAYLHDITWAYIWKSQFLMLTELNRNGGLMPLAKAKQFYDQAVIAYPSNYSNYTFGEWMIFMGTQGLVIKHPSDMLEITVRGRDFLVYSAHTSRTANDKKG